MLWPISEMRWLPDHLGPSSSGAKSDNSKICVLVKNIKMRMLEEQLGRTLRLDYPQPGGLELWIWSMTTAAILYNGRRLQQAFKDMITGLGFL
jgi:hypothetical protein